MISSKMNKAVFSGRLYDYINDNLVRNKECTLVDENNKVVAYISYDSNRNLSIKDDKEHPSSSCIIYEKNKDSIELAINLLSDKISSLMNLRSIFEFDEIILNEVEFIERIIRKDDVQTYEIVVEKQYTKVSGEHYFPTFDVTLINQHTCGFLIKIVDSIGLVHKYRINTDSYKKLVESDYFTDVPNQTTMELAYEIYKHVKQYTDNHQDKLDEIGDKIKKEFHDDFKK